MTAQWVGEIVGKLHIARIAHKELAEQMGVTSVYVSMVLNGKRTPKGAEARFNAADYSFAHCFARRVNGDQSCFVFAHSAHCFIYKKGYGF